MFDKDSSFVLDASVAFVMAFVMSQIFVLVSGVTMSAVTGMSMDAVMATTWGVVLLSAINQLAFLSVFIYFYRKKKAQFQHSIFTRPNFGKMIFFLVLGLIAVFTLNDVVALFELLIKNIGHNGDSSLPLEINSLGKYVLAVITMAVIPGICEELLFRGVIARNLATHNKVMAVVVSAMMFSIFHLSAYQLLYPFLLGLLLGIVYVYTQNIFYVIGIHVFNNFVVLTISYFFPSGAESTAVTISTVVGAVVGLAIFLGMVALLWCKSNKKVADDSRNAGKLEDIDTLQNDAAVEQNRVAKKSRYTEWIAIVMSMTLMTAIWCIIFVAGF